MKNSKNYTIVNNYRIYTLDYLMHGDLLESDLEALLNNHALTYSLIINMFDVAGYKIKPETILNTIKSDDKWMEKYTWTHNQLTDYEAVISDVFYNVYRYRNEELKSYVQWFIIQYGLTVKN